MDSNKSVSFFPFIAPALYAVCLRPGRASIACPSRSGLAGRAARPPPRLRAEKLSQELERLRIQQETAAPSPSPEDKPASTFATLILTIGGTRSTDGGSPAVLQIPAGTEQVRLQLNLRENDYSHYQAVLQSAAGNTIFTSKQLTAVNKKTGANLTLVVPARMLSTGDYILTLRGVSKTGEVEDLNKSLFRVERK